MLAHDTQDLPDHLAAEAEPVLVEAARRLDPPRLRRVIGHLRLVADPDGADRTSDHRYQRRGLWLSPTWEGMVAIQGLLDPEAGQTLLAALEPLARPSDADDARTGGQRRADALTELARRTLEGGRLPQSGGVRPQLLVTVDLDSLLGPGGLGGEAGGAWPLDPETCRRLACDAAVTRVLVTRHPTHQDRTATTTGRPRPRRQGQPAGLAPDGGDPASPDPGRHPHPTTGGGPHQPGRHPRPTRRLDRPRRRLCGGWL